MDAILSRHPETANYLDDSEPYQNSATEFRADGQRWLLVTQQGETGSGQILFRFFGNQLLPVRADTIVDLNPSRRELEELRNRSPTGPAPAAEHERVAERMRADVNVFSTTNGPQGGNLACVWAVRHLVRNALGRWITRTDSTSHFAEELALSLGESAQEAQVSAGGIVISPTNWAGVDSRVRHGHVGLLGPRVAGQDRLIYSNSSARARWEQNFTLPKWRRKYEQGSGLEVLFYPLPAQHPALVAVPDAIEESFASLAAPPDPLAGEGRPQAHGIVLDGDVVRATGDLPISRRQAHQVAHWMKSNFGAKLQAASTGTPFSIDLLCAIVCQETAYFWVGLINSLPAQTIVERCVLDASGDYPGTSRSVFPRNTAEFRSRCGGAFTELLIDEANKTRALRGYGPKQWVYKGYGIFQYDLQYVIPDQAFFEGKQWYSFETCLAKCVHELKEKYRVHNDLWKAVRAYNGSGPTATRYANNVFTFREWCAETAVS